MREWERGPSRERGEERKERLERDKIRYDRRCERDMQRRLEARDGAAWKKSKITRDGDREIGEKIALGMASTGTGSGGGEVMYDQRLFNQEKGTASGFETDDQYNLYDKGLFAAQPTLSTLYKPKKSADPDMYGGVEETMGKIRKTDRFELERGLPCASKISGPGGKSVKFEKEAEEDDVFGLQKFLTEMETGKKATEKVGCGGKMRSCGGSIRGDNIELVMGGDSPGLIPISFSSPSPIH